MKMKAYYYMKIILRVISCSQIGAQQSIVAQKVQNKVL